MDEVYYMLLDLDKVEIRELFRLLFHKHIGARTFISSNEDELLCGTFCRRFVIFISILIIKGLKLISNLMERLGCFIESSLNLWSRYDSFYVLIFNTLRGKNVELCRESPNFSSIIGLTDTRFELDNQIPREDLRYKSALAIMASKMAYENEARVQKIVQDHWKMEYLGFYNCSNAFNTKPILTETEQPTQVFIFSDKTGDDQELIYVSFRGTSPLSADDWCTDLDLSWFNLDGIGKVHMGFLKALGLQKNNKKYAWLPKELIQDKDNKNTYAYYKIRHVLKDTLKENKNARFIVTGHSLGGALAVLFPAILAFHNEFELLEKLDGVYTFGQPRVGNDEFCQFMDKLLGVKRYFRFVYANDIVPRIPFDDHDFKFKHFGYCYYYNSFYKGKIIFWDLMENGIVAVGERRTKQELLFDQINWSDVLNAIFEMVRSFVLPHAYGRNYKEGILLIVVRLFGLIIPGISAHCPQDYVNLTRLTSPEIFDSLQYDYSFE